MNEFLRRFARQSHEQNAAKTFCAIDDETPKRILGFYSITPSAVAHDGVFKIALLTLFDLPLERFWMWTMDLAAITVVDFRAGRPALRAHNLTGHLAALLDEEDQERQEARSRSGAL